MQEQPSYVPPGAFTGDPPQYNPYGPVGQRVDVFSETGATIGQQALSEYPPIYGWWLGERNTAIPAYELGILGQPSQFDLMAAQYYAAGQYAAVQQQNTNAEFMAALLLMMF